ncbi:hypothetical protein Moror_4954 [Moniliophthora roreri MCA 2997]|uniref:Extracellular membrane protein CFEM domain-containing protein n=2 Tax=Moniliophthora roreri TaxID=221103 RepID=V2WHS2_MONRO|nr:hypothetical protein Moror_4954 [Moniliophthora roreri MCA 2997]
MMLSGAVSSVVLSTLLALVSTGPIAVYASENAARSVNELSNLFARQTGNGLGNLPSSIPSACQNTCAKLSSCGTSVDCICTNTGISNLSSCLSCAASNDSSFSASDAQELMNNFTDGCKALGYDVKPQTISGNSKGGSSGSSAANGNASGGGDNGAIANGATLTGIGASVVSVLLLL